MFRGSVGQCLLFDMVKKEHRQGTQKTQRGGRLGGAVDSPPVEQLAQSHPLSGTL